MQIGKLVMTLQLLNNAALCIILTLMLQVSSVYAQSGSFKQVKPSKSYQVVSEETYNRVLDILFPRQSPASSKTVWIFVLRFKPSSNSESQIVIRRRADKI